MKRILQLCSILLLLPFYTARAQQDFDVYRSEEELRSHYDSEISDLRQRIKSLYNRIAVNTKEIRESDSESEIRSLQKDIEICEIDIARFKQMIHHYEIECRNELQAYRDRKKRAQELADKLKREEEAKIKAQKKLEKEAKQKAAKAEAEAIKKQKAAIKAEQKRQKAEKDRIRREEEKREREELEKQKAIQREQIRQDRMAQTNPHYSSKKDQARSRANGESFNNVVEATQASNYINQGRAIVGETPTVHNKRERESLRDMVQKKSQDNPEKIERSGKELYEMMKARQEVTDEERKKAIEWKKSQKITELK